MLFLKSRVEPHRLFKFIDSKLFEGWNNEEARGFGKNMYVPSLKC